MPQYLYLAVSKKTGNIMSGAKGQYAFDSQATLGRSVGQNYQFEAHRQGVKPKDLYDVYQVDPAEVIQIATQVK